MSVVVEPRARVFCALCLYCGLRKEEALGLQWSDIQSNSLTVRRAMTFLNNQQDPVDDLKTKAAHRVIPIPDKLRAILLDTPHLSRYIVPASNGGDMTRSAFTRMWNSHVVSLGAFSSASPHAAAYLRNDTLSCKGRLTHGTKTNGTQQHSGHRRYLYSSGTRGFTPCCR